MSKEYEVADETMNLLIWIGNGLLGLGAWALMYTGLPAEPAAILAVLMCIDFVAGVSRARTLGEAVTSHRMKVGAISKCGVLTAPLCMSMYQFTNRVMLICLSAITPRSQTRNC